MRLTSPSEKVYQVFNYLFLLAVSATMLIPLWHVLMFSLSDATTVYGGGLFLLPKDFSLGAYRIILRDPMIGTAYKNTIWVVVVGTAVNLTLSFLLAYPLCKKDLKGRSIIQYGIFFTMLFSGGMIPTYLVVNQLGLINSHWSLILPGAVSTYNVFVLRNFISTTIPESLPESARIDGASEVRILIQIIVPLSKPVLAVLGLWYGVGHWNAWFACIIYINKFSMYTLQPVLRQILITLNPAGFFAYDPELAIGQMQDVVKMGIIMVATIPILCIYPFLQKYFVKGVMLGAVKG